MAKKVPFYALWDLKSLPSIIIAILICILILIFPVLKEGYNERKLNKLEGITEAFIIEINERELLRQGRGGNKLIQGPYIIKYEYFVNDMVYQNTETIDSDKWKIHLKINQSDTLNHSFSVRFNPESPSQALLELKHFGN